MTDGLKPPESADKSLGEIVGDVSQKTSQLVREEVELAKAEVQLKISRLGKGAGAFGLAAFFALMALIFLLHAAAWGLALIVEKAWFGYAATGVILLLLTGLAVLFGVRMMKKGTPPTPELAIEEAKRTREAIGEARR
jgi:uncharacterized membrane protein YqjE